LQKSAEVGLISDFECALTVPVPVWASALTVSEELSRRLGTPRLGQPLEISDWIAMGGAYPVSFSTWSTVSARMPNIRCAITFCGPRTRTCRPPNSSFKRAYTRSTAVRSRNRIC
jgi:hypothetical protein